MLFVGMLGLVTGLIFGFVVQRGRFDVAAGVQALHQRRDASGLKAYVLAVVIQAAAIYMLVRADVAEVPAQPYYWLAAVMGGLIFGGGMALTGSGAAGIWSRTGQGAMDAVITVLGFAIGAAAAKSGFLAGLVRDVQSIQAEAGTLYTLMDVGFGTAVSFAALLAMWWFTLSYRAECSCKAENTEMLSAKNLFPNVDVTRLDGEMLMEIVLRRPWSWIATGITMGAVASVAWYTAAHSAAKGGLEMTTGTAVVS